MPTVRLIIGDVRDVMSRMIADGEFFHLLVTSPPFLALRSYLPADHPDKAREIGSEPTPADFLSTLYGLTADWGRLLPEWASICVELGDTMSNGDAGGTAKSMTFSNAKHVIENTRLRTSMRARDGWPLAKSMCILPHAYTLGLAYGMNPLTGTASPAGRWRIRNVITWARPNPPVGSLGKRNPQKRTGDYKFRPACSYITVACRGTGRYFDLDAVRHEQSDHTLRYPREQEHYNDKGVNASRMDGGRITAPVNPVGAPPLDWHTDHLDGDWLWKLATAPYPGAHYATYPLTLPRRLILAMCPESVCIECGWPRERMTGETKYVNSKTGKPTTTLHFNGDRRAEGENHWDTAGQGDRAAVAITPTLGFTDCDCVPDLGWPCAEWERDKRYRSGRVLDPFGGSGTTAVAAALEGRDCTLIDLDARNVELIRRRLSEKATDTEALRIVSETCDGDRWTWEVEVISVPQHTVESSGQTNLFEAL